LRVVLLTRDHDRTGFDCGVPELNRFLKATARQHNDKGISRTFVLIDEQNPKVILGFFTLTICEVSIKAVPAAHAKKYPPQHGLPAVRLARLAVSVKEQGKRYGEALLGEAVHRTATIAGQAGLIGLFVDAKDEAAKRFYEKYGFVSTEGRPRRQFLPVETLLQL
jgi:ribosomal protein S18 acetylase RimI-like enzyme